MQKPPNSQYERNNKHCQSLLLGRGSSGQVHWSRALRDGSSATSDCHPQEPNFSAGIRVISPFRSKDSSRPLQELHIGTIQFPFTLGFEICPPSVGSSVQPLTEHSAGHGLREPLIQCFFHVPQGHVLSAVPFTFFHPVAVMTILPSLG